MPPHSTPSVEEYLIAYSYIRFSHPEQSKGDSLRRQIEAAAEWCEHNKIHLDTSLTLHDLGSSAYTGSHRQNPDRHALAMFLKLVEQGKVSKGSYLVIENLDRLSREEEVPACHLLTSILMAGIRVVQLKPSELVLTEKSPGWDIMRAVMELSRGHGESAIKSERVGKAWREKKRRAREEGKLITHRLPAWIELRDGKRCLVPERARIVKRIFELTVAGYGLAFIVSKFTREGVAAFGIPKINEGRKRPQYSGKWNRPYIANILKDRRALGELQPYHRDGSPDGPPIKDYFPAVVSEDVWHAARAAAEQRRCKRGRASTHINVFSGLLKEARGGESYFVVQRGSSPSLVNNDAWEGRARLYSFPLLVFEDAILGWLREVNPREILEGVNGHDEVMVLEGELGEVEAAIASIEADLDAHGESPRQYARLRAKEARLAELNELLKPARQRAANPLSVAWGETQSLLKTYRAAQKRDPEDAGLRLRGALRRIIESISLLVVVRGATRLAAVQMWFTGGHHRDYLIEHKAATRGVAGSRQPQRWRVSLSDVADVDDLDLRRREDAEALAIVLERLNLAELESEERRF
ncbi:MAG TPA: recombinase family protein [Gemmataceae bacterium]|nr:recombinase family protein [Gemmataceae bacterium]